MCFFLSHSFVDLAMCFGSLSCWNTHPRPIFNTLALTVHDSVHFPFDAVKFSRPLTRKTLPNNVSTSMFDSGDGVLGVIDSIPPPPNTASWVDAKELDFGLIWPQHFSHSSPLNHWETSDSPVHVLSWAGGTLRALQDFSPSRRSVLPIVFLVTMVPAALRSLTRSSRVVLGWFLTILMISETPDLACSTRPKEIDSYFVFLSFANNSTNCCPLLPKLLGDGLVAHSSLVYVYNLVPDILGQLFGLGHGGEFGIWLIASVDRCLLKVTSLD